MDSYNLLVYILAYIGFILVSFYMLGMAKHFKKGNYPSKTDKSVSIIIPAYNEEKSIERTIKSALSLDYPSEKLRIIVVDDGSKDNTFKIAQKCIAELEKAKDNHPDLIVLTKKNGGKGTALNYGISKSKSDVIVTMDADTFVKPDSLKKMIGYFYSEKVMSVTPSIGIYNPKGFWQKIQHIEYYMSVFLRKSFGAVNAIHITPGAFAAYRREFFLKHEGFDENNITEDIELSLRIQSHHYIIENTPYAVVYTLCPRTFKQFLAQRKRWYVGYLTNLWRYKGLFSPKYGALGMVVLPAAIITLALAIVITVYSLIRGFLDIKDHLVILQAAGFNFNNMFEINKFIIEQFLYRTFSQPIFIFAVIFILLLLVYLSYSRKTMGYKESIASNYVRFIIGYSLVYTLFWLISIFYIISGRRVKWK